MQNAQATAAIHPEVGPRNAETDRAVFDSRTQWPPYPDAIANGTRWRGREAITTDLADRSISPVPLGEGQG